MAACLVSASLAISSAAIAEDIDLFKGGGAQDPSPPNVMILLDNTSNWSANNQAWSKSEVITKCGTNTTCLGYVNQIFGANSSLVQGQVELAAIKLVINELVCGVSTGNPMKVNVGLMMLKPSKGAYSNDSGTSTSASGLGGFIRRAIAPLDSSRCSAITGDLDTIYSKVTDPAWKASADANYGGAMFDAFKYYGGHTNPANAGSGTAGSPTGHISFGPLRFATATDLEDAAAFRDSSKLAFQSPITSATTNTCGGKNYILLIGNGYPTSDVSSLLTGLGYTWDNPQFANASKGYLSDVWAKFLSTTDTSPLSGRQNVITSTLNVYNNAESSDQTALLKSMAKHGNGSYYQVGGNLGQLVESLKNFFISINAANQAFAPATLPSSVGSGGLNINQVYLGMFRPEKNPRWFGNLKLYQLGLDGMDDNGTLLTTDDRPIVYLGDSKTPPERVQSGTGFIIDGAISFWTHSSDFWKFRCDPLSTTGDPLLCGLSLESDIPDGSVVEKGGAAQKLRDSFTADASNSARKVFTDDGTSLINFISASSNFDPTGTTLTDVERTSILNWARGVDNIGENTLINNGARPSMVGDVLHSEPVAVDYGVSTGTCSSTATGDIVTFYAGNDGFLHAVSGGKTEGGELWSYIPKDFLNQLKRLRDNSPAVTLPSPVPAGTFNKPYLIDGSLSYYAPDANGDCKPEKVLIFVTLRRGGRSIYGLDVTSKTSPKLLWKKTFNDSGYGELGQTWSKLKPIKLADGKAALIFGAGYDPKAEDRPFDTTTGAYGTPVNASREMGRGVFVIDAETGALKKFFGAGSYSIPSDVAVVSNINTGHAERAYVGDTGGNIWRIRFTDSNNMASANAGQWSMTKIAALGTDQKFLYPPDIALCGGQDVILIGSGNREEPFDRLIQNRFYQIADPATGEVGLSDLVDVTSTGTAPDTSKKGWYFKLATGEKTVGSAVTQSGTTSFPTNEAASNSGNECSTSLGTARLYGVSCSTGGPSVYAPVGGTPTARSEIIPGGGFPPSPTPAVVTLTDKTTGEKKTVETVLSGSHVGGSKVVSTKRRITYWYREGLD